ncbi:MAG: hypothetical protein KJT03_04990 [Verrucomicrobiae bacterium]|nr:hypothetical protein [Verrucomicrobiae bacterium]
MKTQLALVAILSTFLTVGALADSKDGPQRRLSGKVKLQTEFTQVNKGDELVLACKVCDAMSVVEVDSEVMANSFCQEGEELTCPSCETKLVVHKNNPGPRSKGKPARHFKYVNQHGEDCLIVSKVVQES